MSQKATKAARKREARELEVVGSSAWSGTRKAAESTNKEARGDEPPHRNPETTARRNYYPRSARTAAVCMTVAREGGTIVKEAMTKIRKEIDLPSIKIEVWDTRKTMTGGTLLESKSPEKKEQAKALARKIEEVLSGTGVSVDAEQNSGSAATQDRRIGDPGRDDGGSGGDRRVRENGHLHRSPEDNSLRTMHNGEVSIGHSADTGETGIRESGVVLREGRGAASTKINVLRMPRDRAHERSVHGGRQKRQMFQVRKSGPSGKRMRGREERLRVVHGSGKSGGP